MFSDSYFRRVTSALVLVTFTALTLRPLEAVAQAPARPSAPAAADTDDERYARSLIDIHELLKELAPAQAMPEAFRLRQELEKRKTERSVRAIGPDIRITVEEPIVAPKVDFVAKLKALRAKFRELDRLEASAERSFAAMERHLREKNLPGEILARHQAAVAEYEARKSEFKALARAVESAADRGEGVPEALASLGAFLAKYPSEKTHTPTDPNNLPWRSPKPVERKPATTREEFRKLGLFGEPVRLAQAGSLSGISLPTTTPPATPTPEDLAETEDVQITQAIRDLASSLGNNPVKIFNWVRNNVQFVPSYGSIQGSDLTLQTKRGNAFDTASLLIALMRAANIPARYVYGTIEVPAEQVMNWVGGVTVPEAAQNLMGQGGIPNLGVASGGRITAIRLEHVWVEAFVDWVPSRGAVHRQGDTWVPMDASFKQYAYSVGMSVQANVSFAAQGFLDAIRQGAEVNEAEGWVRNVNQALVQSTLASYQNQVKAYVDAQKPNATVGDMLGTQTIVQDNAAILTGALPYRTVATGAKFATAPDNLRWKFRYTVYASSFERANDNPFISLTRSTPLIGGKKITLSFAPATQADVDLIASFLPPPNPDGSPIAPEQLPTSLPGYLIRLVPELRVEGQVVATGPAFTMGQELVQNAGFYDPSRGWQYGDSNIVMAGDFVATATVLQAVSRRELDAVKGRIQQAKAGVDAQQFTGITREEVAGDLLFATATAYFATALIAAEVTSRANSIVSYSNPGFGNVATITQPRLFFGVPRQVALAGVEVDIDRLATIGSAKDNLNTTLVTYRRMIGSQSSAYEHLIPELLFVDALRPGEAVSAVKLLARAAEQGQRLFTLTRANLPAALTQLIVDSSVREEIQNAVESGMEVTVHSLPVTINGWSGTGYVILDPETGAAAYKITGGASGGAILLGLALLVVLAAVFFQFVAIYYASVVLIGFVSAAVLSINVLVSLSVNTSGQDVAALAAARYMGTIAIALAFVSVGYVALPAVFGVVAIAALIALSLIIAKFIVTFASRDTGVLLARPASQRLLLFLG